MKIIIFVLFPLILIAQNNLPDTVVILDGRSFPCLVTGVGEQDIRLSLPGRNNEPVNIQAIKKLTVDPFGIILSSGKWMDVDRNKLKEFIDSRFIKVSEQNKINEELKRESMKMFDGLETAEQTAPVNAANTGSNDFNRWSFGVLYVPYFSGNVYKTVKNTFNEPMIYSYSESRTDLEAQLAYGITPEFKITFDAGYSSAFSEIRTEYHFRSDYSEADEGTNSTVGLKLLDFSLGIKYYFKNIIPGKVSFYTTLGGGRQFAFSKNEYIQLFIEPVPGIINTDNIEEFTEEINSPWHLNFGFGAEYFFNESLSLTSDITVLYTSVSGEYQSRYVTDFQSISRIDKRTFSDFVTKIGIGLNFYF
jgi:hypothetical protein